MIRYRLSYANQFWVDFQEVLDGILKVSLSPASAKKWRDKILEKTNSLQVFPNAHPICWFDKRYRSTNVGKYKIIFQVLDDIRVVRISRLILARRNLSEIFT